ncbi:V-type proton ATPase subunit G1 [Hibiscus syriacus]|uniref:V-type proton ATPase subunit G1 n=1 Tax=Hibiscus syriacus TaxID=106335 RepID=A0A6A3B2X4_HIBSY|nr:V-type proton ATPase subunit G1 [Hibiscus syriacus]
MVVTHHRARRWRMLSWQQNFWSLLLVASWQRSGRTSLWLQQRRRRGPRSSRDSGANVKRLEIETDAKINHLKNEAARISHDVVQMLLNNVTTMKN